MLACVWCRQVGGLRGGGCGSLSWPPAHLGRRAATTRWLFGVGGAPTHLWLGANGLRLNHITSPGASIAALWALDERAAAWKWLQRNSLVFSSAGGRAKDGRPTTAAHISLWLSGSVARCHSPRIILKVGCIQRPGPEPESSRWRPARRNGLIGVIVASAMLHGPRLTCAFESLRWLDEYDRQLHAPSVSSSSSKMTSLFGHAKHFAAFEQRRQPHSTLDEIDKVLLASKLSRGL